MVLFWGGLTLLNGILAAANLTVFAASWHPVNLIFGILCAFATVFCYVVTNAWSKEV